MAELDVWQALCHELSAGNPCALLAVAASRGSSPGKPGALLALGQAGPLAGTIGGGMLEHEVVSSLLNRLRNGQLQPGCVVHQHRVDAPAPSGMVCGGEQCIVVTPLGSDQSAAVSVVAERLQQGLTVRWQMSPDGWKLDESSAERGFSDRGFSDRAGRWLYLHCSGPSQTVYLVGGGHVSRALSRLLNSLDFRVVVIEEREGIASFVHNTDAHDKHQLAYENLAHVIEPDRHSLVAIMTHGHQRDAAALAAVRELPLGYLGLLGSHHKIQMLTGSLPMPSHFHAPMGLPIGSQTPEEIAISIAAQLIALRRS